LGSKRLSWTDFHISLRSTIFDRWLPNTLGTFKGIQLLPSLPAGLLSDPKFLTAVTLPVFELFLHAMLTAFFMLYFSTVITLDLLRGASVRLLDRASAPETKPIGYFTSLLSVFVALFTLVGQLIF
jgi:hypothetical protein